MNKKGFILSTYVYILLVFFLLLLVTMLAVLNNSKLLSTKLKEQTQNSSGLLDKNFSFVLLGDKDIVLRKGEEYIEPSYIAKTSKGIDIKENVKVVGNVDVSNPNSYTLKYKLTYNGVSKELKRNIHVIDSKISNYVEGLYAHQRDVNGLIMDTTADKNIRYAGSNPNNYVYFNCKDKDASNISYGEDNYNYESSCEVWRIIGVFEVDNGEGKLEKRVKLVRDALPVNMSYDSSLKGSSGNDNNSGYGINQWGISTNTDGSIYKGADLMQMLNGYYIGKEPICNYCNERNQEPCINDCTSSITPLSNTSLKMTGEVIWKHGSKLREEIIKISEMYEVERGTGSSKICGASSKPNNVYLCTDTVIRTQKSKGVVGLIYASDYAYASTDQICPNDIAFSDSTCNNNNWLYPNYTYWTLSPYAVGSYSAAVWSVSQADEIAAAYVFKPYSVRPSLYLSSNVEIIGGDGATTPYKLGLVE